MMVLVPWLLCHLWSSCEMSTPDGHQPSWWLIVCLIWLHWVVIRIFSIAFNILMLIYLHRHLPFFWTKRSTLISLVVQLTTTNKRSCGTYASFCKFHMLCRSYSLASGHQHFPKSCHSTRTFLWCCGIYVPSNFTKKSRKYLAQSMQPWRRSRNMFRNLTKLVFMHWQWVSWFSYLWLSFHFK